MCGIVGYIASDNIDLSNHLKKIYHRAPDFSDVNYDFIENKYIGLLNTTQNFHSYKYDVAYLCRNYKLITGKNFKIPRSKISWRKY